MAEVRIVAQQRSEFGKGGARRTRRAGQVPAVLYGHGQDPRHLSLPARELANALRGGANTLLALQLDGDSELALPKAVQTHPVRGELQHVDLLLVRRGEKVTVDVHVSVVGEPAPGGMLNQELTTLSVEAEATAIPQGFEIDVEGMDIGSHVTAGQVTIPFGVTLVTDAEALVVGIMQAPTAEDVEAELAEAEAEAGIEREPSAAETEEAAAEAEGERGGQDEAADGAASS